jgi:hypothetical protein
LRIHQRKANAGGDYSEQLAVYALYIMKDQKQNLQNVTVQPVYLSSRQSASLTLSLLCKSSRWNHRSRTKCEKERNSLTSGTDSEGRPAFFADSTNFAAHADSRKCTNCSLRSLCAEGQAAIDGGRREREQAVILPITDVAEIAPARTA